MGKLGVMLMDISGTKKHKKTPNMGSLCYTQSSANLYLA